MSLIAVVHVGSASVSGALLDGKKIIFATETECRFQDKLDPAIFSQTITDSFRSVVQSLANAKLGSPARVAVFLSSPFVAGRLSILKHRDDTKLFRVTEKLVSDLIATEVDKFKQDTQHVVIDSKIMRFALNGYEVTAPHDQKVNELEISHYLSLAPRELVAKLTELVSNAFHHHKNKIDFHSFGFATFLLLRHLRPADQSFLVLDIGGELSELALVWQGVIWETLSYPLGSHSLLRERVAKHTVAPTVARAILEQSGSSSLEKLSSAERAWLDGLEQGVSSIMRHRFWSGKIILIAEDGVLAPVFVNLLQSAGLDKSVSSSRKIKVESLASEMLRGLLDRGATKSGLPLLVDAAFVLI